MKKEDMVRELTRATGLSTPDARAAVDVMTAAIANALANGECVYLRGFATFKPYTIAPKKARDIHRDAEVLIPARRSAKLLLGKELKARLNDGK